MCVICGKRAVKPGSICGWCLMAPVRDARVRTGKIQDIRDSAVQAEIRKITAVR